MSTKKEAEQVGGKFEPNPQKAEQEAKKPLPVPMQDAPAKDIYDKLHEYPAALPEGWLPHLVGVLRGRIKIDVARDAKFGWHVLGYALSQADPADTRQFAFGYGPKGEQNAADNLEAHPDDNGVLIAACRQLVAKCQEKAPE